MTTRSYDSTYQDLFGAPPPQSVTFGESRADIISEARGFMEGFDYTMQLQAGCPAGCLYCYVPHGWMLTPRDVKGTKGEKWGFEVRNKVDVAKKLRRHLEKGRLSDKTIYSSGITDPYATPPSITTTVWQILCEAPLHLRPRRLVVQTRFRVDRDIELIARYCNSTPTSDQGPPVVVSFSIGTDRDDLIRAWERVTPQFEQRMKAIESLRKAGIWVVPTLSPFGVWDNLHSTLEQFKSWNIPYITCLFFKEGTRSANTPPHFLAYLRADYPEVLDPPWQAQRLQEMKAIYGEGRVLVGQEGFTSLTAPHRVIHVVNETFQSVL